MQRYATFRYARARRDRGHPLARRCKCTGLLAGGRRARLLYAVYGTIHTGQSLGAPQQAECTPGQLSTSFGNCTVLLNSRTRESSWPELWRARLWASAPASQATRCVRGYWPCACWCPAWSYYCGVRARGSVMPASSLSPGRIWSSSRGHARIRAT